MKRMTNFVMALGIMLCLVAIPTIVKADSVWKIWEPKTEVDIDKAWTITFNDEVDWDSFREIKVIREKDGARLFVEPMNLQSDEKSVRVMLGDLYDFNETYHLYIEGVRSMKGKALKEPIKMKFQTNNPEFTVVQTVERDGIQFKVQYSQKDTKLYARLKATNVSEKTITYIGFNGCDQGLKARLMNETDAGQVKEVGHKWWTARACTGALEEHQLEPGKTIDVTEVLYLPTSPLSGETHLKVGLVTGSFSDEAALTTIDIEIPMKLDL